MDKRKLRRKRLKKGQRVQVYRNLHTGTWSVKDKKTNLVVCHPDTIMLENAKFHVGEKGNARVRKEKSKNVHAWVNGDVAKPSMLDLNNTMEVTYDPYKYKCFVLKQSGEPIFEAEQVFMSNGKVYISNSKLWKF